MTIDRREFTTRSLLAFFSGVTITITGCGGGGGNAGPSGPSGGGNDGDETGTISVNHGHTAVVTRAELTLGGQVMLDISGNAGHPHTVELSAAEVASIRDGGRVAKTSSTTEAHNHTVTFN